MIGVHTQRTFVAPAAAKTARSEKPTIKIETPTRRSEKTTKVENFIKAAKDAKKGGKPLAANVDENGLGWIDAGKGYQITLDGGKLAAKNDKGKRVSSAPKEIRDGDVADQLDALRDWLVEHDRALADDAEAVQRREPGDGVLNRGRRLAERTHLAAVRQRGRGNQVDQHFGRRLVESKQRYRFAPADLEVVQSQRTQGVVVLPDASYVDDDVIRVSHGARRP